MIHVIQTIKLSKWQQAERWTLDGTQPAGQLPLIWDDEIAEFLAEKTHWHEILAVME